MKRGVSVIALVVMLFLAAGELFAERQGRGRGMGQGRGMHRGQGRMRGKGMCFGNPDYMRETLKLTEDQIKKIGVINEAYSDSLKGQRKKLRPKKKQLRKLLRSENIDIKKVRVVLKAISDIEVEIRLLRIEQRVKIEKVLTPEQRKRLRDERKKKRQRHRR
ncbi:MAG: Spy/CpxP family protein refolding chaperone [bacterium]|nr:Spy/CpxP family protein refolding chaperone [bacterium]